MDGKRKLSFTYNAPVTLTFALVSLIVLGVAHLTHGESTRLFFSVYRSKLAETIYADKSDGLASMPKKETLFSL